MDLVDRYLQAVRGFLPRHEQDDIVRELAEDIRAQIEEKEAGLGRPLLDAELETFIRQLGHPMVLASRFGPQRQLIGAPIFPFYWLALKIALGIALLVHVVVSVVLLASGRPGSEVVETLVRFPTTGAVTVFGWVTLVFAVGQAILTRTGVFESWKPRRLPSVQVEPRRSSRGYALFELVGHAAFLGWLIAVPSYPGFALGPLAAMVDFGPTLRQYYPLMLLLVLGWMTPPAIVLLYPEQRRIRLAVRMAVHVVGLLLLGLILDAQQWVTVKNPSQAAKLMPLVNSVNTTIRISIVCARGDHGGRVRARRLPLLACAAGGVTEDRFAA